MRPHAWLLAALALPALAVDGTIVNVTTGKPVPGAIITLYQFGGGGMEPLATVKSDPQGRFQMDKDAQGPRLLQAIFDGVTYSRMLPQGTPATGLTMEVFQSSKQPGPARVGEHMVLLEPSGGQLNVTETFLYKNEGKTTWNDSDAGTLQFWLPPEAQGIVKVSATSPGGMPVERDASKTARTNVYKLDFPVKPGETRFDVRYLVPFQENGAFAGKVMHEGQGKTRVVAPRGVTLSGDGLQLLGTEPQTQANIYDLKTAEYKLTVAGTGAVPAQNAAAQESGPQVEQAMPKVWENAVPILGLALGILALGFVLLYRAQPAADQGKHGQRGRG
jgi:hypothetical protein